VNEITRLAEAGFHLVPWQRRSAKVKETRPLVQGYHTKRDKGYVAVWQRMYPDADWAVIPHAHCVLDIEMKNGLDGLRDLASLGYSLEKHDGPVTRTKSGGYHLWFRQPEVPLVGGIHILPGVEAKAENGSVHVPPSYGYDQIRPIVKDCPPLPKEIEDGWRGISRAGAVHLGRYNAPAVGLGHRRGFLQSVAGKLREDFACGTEEIALILRVFADLRCEAPDQITDESLLKIAKYMGTRNLTSYDGLLFAGDPVATSIEELCKQ